VTTLVCCVDRDNDIGERAGVHPPITGWEAVRSLVADVGLADPESASVNCLLASLRITRDLRDEGEKAIVAVLSGTHGSAAGADRAIAAQLDELVARYDLESAVVVIDSTEDERLVPVIESRLRVDGVNRVVVRQARDIESTYYLLKQFLADEELRTTVLVPLGIGLLLAPALLLWFSPTVALAGVISLLGAAVLYKGLGVDTVVARFVERSRDLLYSGQVSVVTTVTALGLLGIGVLAGALAVSEADQPAVGAVVFAHSGVPWIALAAVVASAGRVVDAVIQRGRLHPSALSLPFALAAIGVVIRGFTGYLLEHTLMVGPVTLLPVSRLGVFIFVGVLVSLVGVTVATRIAVSRAPLTES